jgi:hypothetical protein
VEFEAVGPALRIWHDGRAFSPLDVFGLSSVGFRCVLCLTDITLLIWRAAWCIKSAARRELSRSSVGCSAKSGRTIGFMGVGFKAVYKRYGRVRVRDRTWAFKVRPLSD